MKTTIAFMAPMDRSSLVNTSNLESRIVFSLGNGTMEAHINGRPDLALATAFNQSEIVASVLSAGIDLGLENVPVQSQDDRVLPGSVTAQDVAIALE